MFEAREYDGKKEVLEISGAGYADGELFKILFIYTDKAGRSMSTYVDIEAGRVEFEDFEGKFTAEEVNKINERYNDAIWEARGNGLDIVEAVRNAVR